MHGSPPPFCIPFILCSVVLRFPSVRRRRIVLRFPSVRGRRVVLRFCRRVVGCLFRKEGAVDPRRNDEHGHADRKQTHDGDGAEVDGVCCVRHDAHEKGAEERCALAEDVEDPEEAARLIGGDDLGEVGARERLHAALEEPHGAGEHPELPCLRHEYGEQPDACVRGDADEDEDVVAHLFCEFAEDDGGGEGDDLRQQQRQQQIHRIEPERRAEGSRHVDDGVHAVDVEEERDEEEDDALFVGDVALFGEHREEAFEVVAHGVRRAGHEVRLAVGLGEGQGKAEPPQRIDDERDGNGYGVLQVGQQHDGDADEEGDAAPDVSPGIALGGYVVGAVVRGHVHEHGVVKDEARRVKDLCNDEYDEEHQPRHGNAQRRASDHARACKEHEYGTLISRKIAQRAENGADDGDAQRHDARGVAPVGGRRGGVHPALSRKVVEVDGHDGADEQGKRRVSHVVQDPVAFQPALG